MLSSIHLFFFFLSFLLLLFTADCSYSFNQLLYSHENLHLLLFIFLLVVNVLLLCFPIIIIIVVYRIIIYLFIIIVYWFNADVKIAVSFHGWMKWSQCNRCKGFGLIGSWTLYHLRPTFKHCPSPLRHPPCIHYCLQMHRNVNYPVHSYANYS